MSQDFDDPEILADFIIEAKEHLETLEPNLLELEKAPDNLALLNDIFRPMHSLKGASGFLGLQKINYLAHRAENILDELRKGTMLVTSEIMDVILSATDALRQMIDNLDTSNSEGDVDSESVGDVIDAIMAGGHPPEMPLATPVEVIPTEEISVAIIPEPTPTEASPVVPVQAEDVVNEPVAGSSPSISSKEWIATLPKVSAYPLTAFGEGHLRDFIDEAREITENLTTGLLDLERADAINMEDINDLFRFFHNMKGNSGIIGFQELNLLTHEAETLLNRVRHDEMQISHELIDLLLLVVDMMDVLVDGIDSATVTVQPFEVIEVLDCLREVVAGGAIEVPAALRHHTSSMSPEPGVEVVPEPVAEAVTPPKAVQAAGREDDDLAAYNVAVQQQMLIIKEALTALGVDSTQKDVIDALYRSLVAIQNASKFMDFEPIRAYAEITVNLVNAGRTSDMDFGMMVDILSQEVGIIEEMVEKHLASLQGAETVSAVAPAAMPAPVVTPAPVVATPPVTAPVAVATPVAKPAPVAKPVPAPIAAPAAKPAGKAGEKPAETESKSSSTIRVDHEKLDHLMNLIGELIINRNRYTMLARRLEGDPDTLGVAEIAQELSETTYSMARISDDLQDTIMKVRMVPVASVFSRFPRLVRDLSRKSGKEVDLILEGEETELDKSVVEVIGDPLVHLIRNAMDHGIESEADRLALGKPAKGRVVLRAYHRGNSVSIEIEDDGKGLDPEKLRAVAVRKGLMNTEEAKLLSDREAMELIFAPGFSSAEQITDISGRGVGMDVVRTNIKNLKGSIAIASEIGKGARFTLSLPLTLAIIDALMVTVADETYAIPLDAVSETTKLGRDQLTNINGRKAVRLRGEVLGVVSLSELIGLPSKPLPDELSVVVIHNNERRVGFVVDSLLERQEIVIKPLGTYLGDVRGISGATILGDGSVILILDPHEMHALATSRSTASQA